MKMQISNTPETLRINSQTPAFKNLTLFDSFTVSKMASIFVAIHCKNYTCPYRCLPFIHTQTARLRLKKSAESSFLIGFVNPDSDKEEERSKQLTLWMPATVPAPYSVSIMGFP